LDSALAVRLTLDGRGNEDTAGMPGTPEETLVTLERESRRDPPAEGSEGVASTGNGGKADRGESASADAAEAAAAVEDSTSIIAAATAASLSMSSLAGEIAEKTLSVAAGGCDPAISISSSVGATC
jgi:hypothetical protein